MTGEHKPFDVMGVDYCLGCKDYQEWPCRPHLLVALAASQEREQAYRAALPVRQIRRVVTALMGDASDLHVLKKHGPYGSSFLDCTWGSCHLHRELIGVMERAAQAVDGGNPDES